MSFSFFFGFVAFSGLSLFGAVVVVPFLAFLGAGAGVGFAAVYSRHDMKYYKRINKNYKSIMSGFNGTFYYLMLSNFKISCRVQHLKV